MIIITRRQFLKSGAVLGAGMAIARPASAMELALGGESYNYIKREPRERVFTCSPMHAHDNPMIAWVEDDPMAANLNFLHEDTQRLVVELSGITESVRSRGRMSAAEGAAWFQLYDGDRILEPLKRVGKRGAGKWQAISWSQALGEIAGAVAKSDPAAIALMHGKDTSAGMWQRFLHTLGSNTVIPLDATANRRAAWEAVCGVADTVPDFAHSHYILNFGTNFMVTQPDYAAEALDGRIFRRARIVSFDPRCSKTAGLSDEWVPLRPGTDGIVALAMVNYLLQRGTVDEPAIARFSNLTAEKLAAAVKPYTLEKAAAASGVDALTIRRIAREFAESERGCILTGAGTSGHTNGFDTERALMLLTLVTGNFEVQGGNCLPREIALGAIDPVPPVPGVKNPVTAPERFAWQAGSDYPLDVLFGYNTNPAFEAPAAAAWRDVLGDTHKVGLFVAIGTFRNETWDLADLVLPEAHWLERNEPVVGRGSLLPWVGLRQQITKPAHGAKELREILRDIVRATNKPEMARYWQFSETREWLAAQLAGVPGLEKDGGWELMAKHSGVWPIYGYLHPDTRRIVDEQGEEVLPKYGKPMKLDLDPFPHWQAAEDTKAKAGELTLLVHASDYYAGDGSTNNKLLREATLANHVHINYATSKALGIDDGELVRVVSRAGYLVTRAHVTQTVRPDVVTMHNAGGHWGIGGVASGTAGPMHEGAPANLDPDVAHNLWWTDTGVHALDLIPARFDARGGGAARGAAVTIVKAQDGDSYGTVKTDASKLTEKASGEAVS